MGDIFSSNPYAPMRMIQPVRYRCDVCDRSILRKDKAAHERGKNHRELLAELNKPAGTDADGQDAGATKPQPGKNGFACHNCGGDHKARDCDQPRKDTRECRNCKQTGHISSDCPNPRVMTCHNCDEEGHMRQDCTKPRRPRDPATVICNNCQTRGHFARNCTNEKVERVENTAGGDDGGFGGGLGAGGDDGGFGGGFGAGPGGDDADTGFDAAPANTGADQGGIGGGQGGFDEW